MNLIIFHFLKMEEIIFLSFFFWIITYYLIIILIIILEYFIYTLTYSHPSYRYDNS